MIRSNHYQYAEIFQEESIRIEKIHWQLHWFLYGIILFLSTIVYFVQGTEVGKYGMMLSLVNLLYNAGITVFIVKKKYIPWNGYVMVTVNIMSLSLYNFLDGYFISPLAPVTTAAIMLYSVVIFLASLRMDKMLIVWATFFSVVCMDGLYLYFYQSFDPDIVSKIVSADPLGQFYRTSYLILSGVLMYQVPRTMLHILRTQERLAKESLENKKIAQKDALTGAYSRLYFEQYLDNCIGLAQTYHYKVALFFIDLDGLKQINDTFGHSVGDFALKAVVTSLKKVIRDTDIVARVGGDEFVVVKSPVSNETKKSRFGFRLLEAICQKVVYDNKEIMISASIGGAIYPDNAMTAKQLIKCADAAMYEVKKTGKKNMKFYEGAMKK